jgi:phosphohistidine phosphatase SixA
VARFAVLATAVVAIGGRSEGAEPTVFFIVRHAEKAPGNDDVPLSEAGQKRAVQLADILAPMRIDAIFVTSVLRSKQTAAVLNERIDANSATYGGPAEPTPQDIFANHQGKRVLIVGHSPTVPLMIKELTEKEIPIGNQYDNLFIVTVDDTGTSMVRLRYGAPTE